MCALPAYLDVTTFMLDAHRNQERASDPPGTGVIDDCEPPCDLNPYSLEEEPVLLMTE